MEEKERYVYHEVSNEVEQYECYYDTEECYELFDDEDVLNRLNEQDFELKKLNQENIKLIEENQQLKQQLHDLPRKIVEEVEKNFTEYLPLKDKTGAGFYLRLNAILKKYGGEDEN